VISDKPLGREQRRAQEIGFVLPQIFHVDDLVMQSRFTGVALSQAQASVLQSVGTKTAFRGKLQTFFHAG